MYDYINVVLFIDTHMMPICNNLFEIVKKLDCLTNPLMTKSLLEARILVKETHQINDL